jgi:hypothetical protein
MKLWTGAQHAFAVKAFYKNNDSFVITQREFQKEFGIHHDCAVPSAHGIKTWVQNIEATDPTLQKKGGSVKTVRTPKNIVVVREAIERSPHRSACRHSVGCLKPAFDRRNVFPTGWSYEPHCTRFHGSCEEFVS